MAKIDVHEIADHAKFNGFHGMVLFWCAIIIIFDGYDLAVAGIALPSIMKEMGVTPATAGYMVSSALFGMMFGAMFLGTIADKIGRILSGDPNYADNWHDIQGYAKLVEDRLPKN